MFAPSGDCVGDETSQAIVLSLSVYYSRNNSRINWLLKKFTSSKIALHNWKDLSITTRKLYGRQQLIQQFPCFLAVLIPLNII